MEKLGKFVRLPPEERSLLLRAALLLMAVRLALVVMPFRSVERATRRLREGGVDAPAGGIPRERLVWAVEAADRSLPGARCLAQAIVLKALLERYGYPARIRLGFAKDGDERFEGHAWVECRGQVMSGGGPSLSRFGR